MLGSIVWGGLIRVEGSPRVCESEITSFPELSPMTVILKSTVGWGCGGVGVLGCGGVGGSY